jgi:hypothetical protein
MEQLKRDIEKIFRESDSNGELFDTFMRAIHYKINDLDLYKILLANISLSIDELKLFTEKVCSEFSDLTYDIYLWSATILENVDSIETAFEYYNKAIDTKKIECKPYLSIIKMYNADLDFPPRNSVIQIFKRGLNDVKFKSKLCYGIADFYSKLNNENMKNKYLALAANYMRKKL